MTSKIDEAYTIELTGRYLAGQKWFLRSAEELGREVWQEVSQVAHLSAEQFKKRVEQGIWQKYGELLHNCCLDQTKVLYQPAWEEVAYFMSTKIAPNLLSQPDQQQELVQNSLKKLQKKLETEPLNTPRTFLAYIVQVMTSGRVDLHRVQTAQKRGGEDGENYIEELEEKDAHWERRATNPGQSVENEVSELEIQQQLEQFFRQHLPTELQYKVAVAHFIEGLEPGEIASLLGKPAHEVRLVKARIVQKLRSLSEEERVRLYQILGVEKGGMDGNV